MKKIERSGAGFAISLEPITKVNAWKIGEESQLLRHGIETYRRCFHRDPELKAFGATCEAPLFAERGIDTLIFGPGSIKNAHAKDEYVEVGQLIKAAEYFSMLIESMLVA